MSLDNYITSLFLKSSLATELLAKDYWGDMGYGYETSNLQSIPTAIKIYLQSLQTAHSIFIDCR